MYGGPKKGGGSISLGRPKALDTRAPPGPHITRYMGVKGSHIALTLACIMNCMHADRVHMPLAMG